MILWPRGRSSLYRATVPVFYMYMVRIHTTHGRTNFNLLFCHCLLTAFCYAHAFFLADTRHSLAVLFSCTARHP